MITDKISPFPIKNMAIILCQSEETWSVFTRTCYDQVFGVSLCFVQTSYLGIKNVDVLTGELLVLVSGQTEQSGRDSKK